MADLLWWRSIYTHSCQARKAEKLGKGSHFDCVQLESTHIDMHAYNVHALDVRALNVRAFNVCALNVRIQYRPWPCVHM